MNMIEYEHEKHLNNKYMSFLHTSEPLLKCSYKSILYTCNYHFKTPPQKPQENPAKHLHSCLVAICQVSLVISSFAQLLGMHLHGNAHRHTALGEGIFEGCWEPETVGQSGVVMELTFMDHLGGH